MPSFDPSNYPRTYRAKGIGLVILLAFCGAMTAGGIVPFISIEVHDIQSFLLLSILSIIPIILGIFLALSALKERVTLYADAVETEGVFYRRRVERNDIAGKSVGPDGTLLFQKSPPQRMIRVGRRFLPDPILDAWMLDIPKIDRSYFGVRHLWSKVFTWSFLSYSAAGFIGLLTSAGLHIAASQHSSAYPNKLTQQIYPFDIGIHRGPGPVAYVTHTYYLADKFAWGAFLLFVIFTPVLVALGVVHRRLRAE
jgi:hypothetical protein